MVAHLEPEAASSSRMRVANGGTPAPDAEWVAMCDASAIDEAKRDEVPAFEASASPPRLVWLATADIFAALPPRKWTVPGLAIGPGRPTLLAAYGFSGKSLAAQQAALAVAAGRRVWEHFASGRGVRVGHLDHEQGEYATRLRYQRLARGHGIAQAELEDRLQVAIFPSVYLNDDDAVDAYARACEGIELVVLDALRGATPGEDENDSKIARCLHNLSRVSENTGTAFLVLHHAGKPKEGHADARTIPRGSSAIFDACGCVLVLSGDKGAPKLVRQEKTPAESAGGAAEDFYLAVEDVADDADPRAGVKVFYRTKEEVDPPRDGEAEFETVVRRVLECVQQNPGIAGREAIREILRLNAAKVRAAVDTLLQRGSVENRARKGCSLYAIARPEVRS